LAPNEYNAEKRMCTAVSIVLLVFVAVAEGDAPTASAQLSQQPVVTLNPIAVAGPSKPRPSASLGPQPWRSSDEGGNQDGQKLTKRKSVEFGAVVQIGSPSHVHQARKSIP
jgi:hypothetical protein